MYISSYGTDFDDHACIQLRFLSLPVYVCPLDGAFRQVQPGQMLLIPSMDGLALGLPNKEVSSSFLRLKDIFHVEWFQISYHIRHLMQFPFEQASSITDSPVFCPNESAPRAMYSKMCYTTNPHRSMLLNRSCREPFVYSIYFLYTQTFGPRVLWNQGNSTVFG